MTSRDFAYWLQGFFEIDAAPSQPLNGTQVDTIKRHLALAFKHEIDPSFGDAEKQKALNAIHQKYHPSPSLDSDHDQIIRC